MARGRRHILNDTPLEKLRGLGKQSAKSLNSIGLYTYADLHQRGALNAYLQLSQSMLEKPSLNFLYAMVAALEDRDWRDVAKHDKADLLLQLDAYEDIQQQLT